jgi:hypothetical protein
LQAPNKFIVLIAAMNLARGANKINSFKRALYLETELKKKRVPNRELLPVPFSAAEPRPGSEN